MMHEEIPIWFVKLLIISMFSGCVIGAWRNYKSVWFDDTTMYLASMFLGAILAPISVLILTFIFRSAQYLFS